MNVLPPVPPRAIAEYDQDHATLRDLTKTADQHTQSGCQAPGCAGRAAALTIARMGLRTRGRLLALAVAELAELGWHQPAPDYTGVAHLGHEHTAQAIAAHAEMLGDAASAAITAVLGVHIAHPTLGPDSECPFCEGSGSGIGEDGAPAHCHCGCPFCIGCGEPVCAGPCETVEALADALHITPTTSRGETA